nr:hypothetical protein [uncultured Flavobacterium sp.]
MEKLKVGKKLWLVGASYRGSNQEPKEVIVKSVGKLYFTLDGYERDKFSISDLRQKTETNYQARCYLSLQDRLDEIEHNELSRDLKQFFSGYGKVNLTLPQLRQIVLIIKETKENEQH